MKFTLTIEAGSAAEILRYLANQEVQITGAIAPVAAHSSEDVEDGSVNLNPPLVDSKGMPWDERIHSENKKTNNDGTWRKRRGIADSVIASVEAELRARTAHPVQQQHPVQQFQPQPMPQPAQQFQPQPAQQFQPQPMPQFQPQPMPQPAQQFQPQPVETGMDFQTFVSMISAGMQNGTIQQADLANMFGAVGIMNLNEAATNPLVLTNCVNYLRSVGKLA